MSFRRSAVVAGTLVAAFGQAHAVAPRPSRIPADTLTALPAAKLPAPVRKAAQMRYTAPTGPAWQKLTTAFGGTWQVATDRATNVPSRIWGSGLPTPGVMASPQIAEGISRALLAEHIALLAPGAEIGDFELVSNVLAGDVRSVGFVQRAGGVRVVGGQVSFRFKRDRMIAIGSEAMPWVRVAQPRSKMARVAVLARAAGELRSTLGLPTAPATDVGDEVVLPLVGDDTILAFRLARQIEIDGGEHGRYRGYADVATGEVLAVHQQNAFALGQLLYRSVDRHPGRARIDTPAPLAHVKVNGQDVTTGHDGELELASPISVTTSVVGDLARILNANHTKDRFDGPLATTMLDMAPAATAVWDATADETDDAQLTAYIATNKVKRYVYEHLDPEMDFLAEQLPVKVNIGDDCNAFWDGNAMNFLQKSDACQNTALTTDVVYHEFGHALHQHQVIDGVGHFDGAMSEGASDFLAAIINNDSGMGRGFRVDEDGNSTDAPLREIDPADREPAWPRDVGEIHATGLIYAGALWDLRKELMVELGPEEGERIVNRLYIATLRRATGIPSSLVESLVEDDDDGNLENGTPHECAIRTAYGRHGLRTSEGTIRAPGALAENARSIRVDIDITGLSTRCASDDISDVRVEWKPSGQADPPGGDTVPTQVGVGKYWFQLPLPLEGKVVYRAIIKFKDSTEQSLPDNPADNYYQTYQGDTIPLYCTTFDDENPFANGWTHGATRGESQWAWGVPTGVSTDPRAAYSGTKILAQNLEGDYEGNTTQFVTMPEIDVGRWSDVRLQYRRWLGTEDNHFDKAKVEVNGRQVWTNSTADAGEQSTLHHNDREWRFHDVALSPWAISNKLQVGWRLESDAGLALGGWQLDDVCLVANIHSICGDGKVTASEGCDAGAANNNEPDSECRTYCQKPTCGDEVVDSDEQCDAGFDGSGFCSKTCQTIEAPTIGGPCAAGGDASGSLAVIGLGVAFVGLRRRRKR